MVSRPLMRALPLRSAQEDGLAAVLAATAARRWALRPSSEKRVAPVVVSSPLRHPGMAMPQTTQGRGWVRGSLHLAMNLCALRVGRWALRVERSTFNAQRPTFNGSVSCRCSVSWSPCAYTCMVCRLPMKRTNVERPTSNLERRTELKVRRSMCSVRSSGSWVIRLGKNVEAFHEALHVKC